MLTVKTVKTEGKTQETIHECEFVVKERIEPTEGDPYLMIYLKWHSREDFIEIMVGWDDAPNVVQHVYVMNDKGKTIEVFHAEST